MSTSPRRHRGAMVTVGMCPGPFTWGGNKKLLRNLPEKNPPPGRAACAACTRTPCHPARVTVCPAAGHPQSRAQAQQWQRAGCPWPVPRVQPAASSLLVRTELSGGHWCRALCAPHASPCLPGGCHRGHEFTLPQPRLPPAAPLSWQSPEPGGSATLGELGRPAMEGTTETETWPPRAESSPATWDNCPPSASAHGAKYSPMFPAWGAQGRCGGL